MPEPSTAYNPSEVEADIYRRWEESGYFNPDKLPNAKRRKPFVISMPPSNITGELHIGHAVGMTVQDLLIRYQRMRGRAALWLPGTDHAAIATQVVIERELKKEGLDRFKLGREKFLERVWKWKEQYGSRITNQTKRLGASADWGRERFTMDEGLTKAVQAAFVKMYKDGLIYRGERIVNWCPDCGTAISDLEVDHEQSPGKLWYLKYPLADKSGFVTVATTRPETMLGDTAVAVNTHDKRYMALVGKAVRLPIVDREIPIIADHRVEKEFGTGAVKVTPGHDPLDWDLGQKHKLPVISVIGTDGRMTTDAGKEFVGKTAIEARKLVVEKFQAAGLLDREEDYIHAVAICSRSKTIIEPLVSRQWFVKMAPLAKPALQAVRRGQIKILPGRYAKVYYQWLENIRDWNISRQIWWGHRLPVWYRSQGENEEVRVAVSAPGAGWHQDEDTLDTWFSSGLWTFSTLGWPSKTSDLRRFHPTDVMETAWDILFFWVARMVMLSKYLVHEVPFKTVYLHGLVLDREGKKMSRSKGNGMDPVQMIDKYGADALRLSLIIGNSPGQDFRLYEEKIAGYRNFANKLWNIGRFVNSQAATHGPAKAASVADKWIMWRLNGLVSSVSSQLDQYQLSSAGQALYDFVWHDFADWYVEWAKLEPNPAILRHVYDTILRLLHPFMPFVTEKLWREMGHDDLLMIAAWPRSGRSSKIPAISEFDRHQRVIGRLRVFRMHAELGGGFGEVVADEATVKIWQTMSRVNLRAVARLTVGGSCREIVLGGAKFHFPIEAVNRFEGWRQKERARLSEYIERINRKLSSSDFSAHAPAAVIESERQKLAQAEIERRALD